MSEAPQTIDAVALCNYCGVERINDEMAIFQHLK